MFIWLGLFVKREVHVRQLRDPIIHMSRAVGQTRGSPVIILGVQLCIWLGLLVKSEVHVRHPKLFIWLRLLVKSGVPNDHLKDPTDHLALTVGQI